MDVKRSWRGLAPSLLVLVVSCSVTEIPPDAEELLTEQTKPNPPRLCQRVPKCPRGSVLVTQESGGCIKDAQCIHQSNLEIYYE